MTEVEAAAATIEAHFGHIEDPRVDYLIIHPLINIMTIALCAIIAGADTWADVARFGQSKQSWLSGFLNLEKGIPSHDTFSTLFARLEPEQLKSSFISWVKTIHQRLSGEVVAVDGKKLRHSFDNAAENPMITMVACDGRPRCFGGCQRGSGTLYINNSPTVQMWSVSPAAMAGVRCTQR
jgi:hypothetical protein